MTSLTSAEKQRLRALAHELEPVVQIGHKGVTESVIAQVDRALAVHELIKVKLGRHVPEEESSPAEVLAAGTEAAVVQTIGKIVVLYRQNEDPEARKIELDRPKAKKKVPDPTDRKDPRIKPGYKIAAKEKAAARAKKKRAQAAKENARGPKRGTRPAAKPAVRKERPAAAKTRERGLGFDRGPGDRDDFRAYDFGGDDETPPPRRKR